MAIFAERFGANHLQLYTTTNRVVLHVANGVAGAIYLVSLVLLYPFFSVYALPMAHLAANVCWYDWYCALLLGGYVISVLLVDWPNTGVSP